ncbi:alpha/beta fold hydrolase [Geobacter sp. SVR]|uniref:alpha/beta fold hydrolase n=1 Tax=Geobacter sp. SVR TaxID=2495594 RepID=UPI00143EFEF1|nr:alpha/beta hydrolase [Geobacter sp. SVR]BCS53874.1 arylesterase [Geobacter sp. SVR]GCF85617.1 arylesterase [Geobacter sp. SVR]
MNFITVGRENSGTIDLYYEDHGSGQPVVLIHGWPLSGASWERQVPVLVQAGYRVITYDRRGFGRSSKPVSGYDYDTLSNDLHEIVTKLDLRDVALVGFSMGGGEVARYLGTHGSERISKAVFMAAIPPFLLKTPDNPEGVDESVFIGIQKAIRDDRPAFLASFFANFYNVDILGGKRISEEAVRLSWNMASGASPVGTHDCVRAWLTDFRSDLKKIRIPVLVIHGDSDRTVPLAASAAQMSRFAEGSTLMVVPGAPHGLNWTHYEEVNRALLEFLGT